MELTFHPEQITRPLRNFWSNIHFHPTDAIEDDWGQRILNRVAEDHVAQTVRMYAMLEDIVSRREDGTLAYDFTENDVRMDYMLEKGFDLLVSYNFIPPCMATDTDMQSNMAKNKTRYKGKMITVSPPRDYGEWEEVCYRYTAHIVERYGLDRVKTWYLQCYNEPDLQSFFMKGDDYTTEDRLREYCKLYDAFARGVCRVCPDLLVGGPTIAGKADFFEGFLAHLQQAKTPIRYICYHTYGTKPEWLNDGTKPLDVKNNLPKIENFLRLIRQYGFGDLPMVIDEWGAATSGFFNREECPQLMFRENEIFSAYYFRLIDLYETLQLPIEKLIICLSGQHEMKVDFSGFRNFFTLNFYPKPIYNAFVLGARLLENRMAFEGEVPETLSVIPSVSKDGKVAIAFAQASEHFDEALPDQKISVNLPEAYEGRPCRLWRIDTAHANAYRAYRRLGSPDDPTPDQIEAIRREGTLVSEEGTWHNGSTLAVENNGVLFLEIG